MKNRRGVCQSLPTLSQLSGNLECIRCEGVLPRFWTDDRMATRQGSIIIVMAKTEDYEFASLVLWDSRLVQKTHSSSEGKYVCRRRRKSDPSLCTVGQKSEFGEIQTQTYRGRSPSTGHHKKWGNYHPFEIRRKGSYYEIFIKYEEIFE